MKQLLGGALIGVVGLFMLSAPNVMAQDFCRGDFTYDGDVDSFDLTDFLNHFGRGSYDRPCPPDGPTPVPKTGQTTSYATGDDGDLERGVALVTPRFTDNGDGTVTDNQTGLIWMKEANCFGFRTWSDALSDCNELASGSCELADGTSAGDWRLPNRFELESLLNLKYYSPAVPDTAGTGQWSEGDPFNNLWSTQYWSSTTEAFDTDRAWFVNMGNSDLWYAIKSNPYDIWCVRGGH